MNSGLSSYRSTAIVPIARTGENSMREITQEVLDHIPDPIAKLVWEKWIFEGKARLINPNSKVKKCSVKSA